MVKKLFSFIPVHKAKLMKKRVDKKRLLLSRVVDFLKSDNYMFAPLVSSQNSPSTASSTVEAYEPMKKKRKKLGRKVKEYMKSDCYLYAPLVLDEPWLRATVPPVHTSPGLVSFHDTSADSSRQGDVTKTVAEENRDLGKNTKSISVADRHVDGYPYTRSSVIRHTLLQKETVKHVIQQNVHPSPVEGEEKRGRSGRKGTTLKGINTGRFKKKKKITRR